MSLTRVVYYNLKLKRNLNKSRSKIKKTREGKLKKLLYYVYENSSFYRQLYKSRGIRKRDLSDIKIEQLPVINKEMVMNNFDDIVTDDNISREIVEDFLEKAKKPTSLLQNKYRVIHTSGSTGEVGYFLYNKKEWDYIKAVALRIFDNFSLKPKRYAFIGASEGNYAGISLFLSPVDQIEELFYQDYLVININHSLRKYYNRLTGLDPHNLTGYPSAVKILAELQREGKIDISPDTIVCGGEPFSEMEKRYITNTWGIKPVNYYATSESLMIGVQRPEDRGIYIFDDINYIEMQENRTLLTNLYNYTQPLIRYELSDVLTPAEKRSDRWPFTQVKEVIGRSEEMLWFEKENGEREFIHPIVLVEFFVKGVKKFKVIQTGKKSLKFKAVINNQAEDEKTKNKIYNKLKRIFKEKNLSHVKINIDLVNNITREKSGKYRLIETIEW